MSQIGFSLFQRSNCKSLRHWAKSQAFDLREDKPHPVSALASFAEFSPDFLNDRILSVNEALKVV
jgi:hypothetical protein